MSVLAYYIVPGQHHVCGQLASITLYCELEDFYPTEHLEKEDADKAWDDFKAGNYWAWGHYRLSVSVELGLETLTEEDHLGGCSYASGEAFVTPGEGYYADMLSSCTDRLTDRIDAIRRQLVGGE